MKDERLECLKGVMWGYRELSRKFQEAGLEVRRRYRGFRRFSGVLHDIRGGLRGFSVVFQKIFKGLRCV